jgi:hypothetical protein
MQRGSLMRVSRKQGPDVWQFRWSERDLNRRRVYRKRVLGSVGRYADEAAARCAIRLNCRRADYPLRMNTMV